MARNPATCVHCRRLTHGNLNGACRNRKCSLAQCDVVVAATGLRRCLMPLAGNANSVCHRMKLFITISQHVAQD